MTRNLFCRGALLLLALQAAGCGHWRAAGRAGMPPAAPPRVAIERFETSKLTYLSLTSQVGLSARYSLSSAGGAAPPLDVHFSITEMVRERTLASAGGPLCPPPARGGQGPRQADAACTFSLRLDRMQGLLARVEIRDQASGAVLASAERPFDCTGDLRTNFRYAGETYGAVERRTSPTLIGKGKTPDDFWNQIPIGTTPATELRGLYDCYQNAAEVSVEEDRGNFTCWEEGNRRRWHKSAYYALNFWLFSLDRMEALYRGGEARGIYMLPWTDGKGLGVQLADPSFPWIYQPNPNGYYPGSYLMNLDPAFRHPLSAAEKKLAKIDTHGQASWLDYIAEDIFIMSRRFQPRAIWWDNSQGAAHIPYTLDKLRGKWRASRPGERPPALMINGDAGYNSDIYWIERDLPEKMDQYIGMAHTLVEERPAVKNGAATIAIGQAHPSLGSGAQEAVRDPRNPYNQARYAFMYRQLLFEGIACDPRVVHQQQWPRHSLEWRIAHFPEAFAEHAKTWGFETMFEHVYNSRDVFRYPLADSVHVTSLPASYEIMPADNTIHLVARAPLSSPDTVYIHLFNYMGTTTRLRGTRPRPAPQPRVALEADVPGYAGEYRVRAFSPDFPRLGDCLRVTPRAGANHLKFEVPVDSYTLVIIDKPWQ